MLTSLLSLGISCYKCLNLRGITPDKPFPGMLYGPGCEAGNLDKDFLAPCVADPSEPSLDSCYDMEMVLNNAENAGTLKSWAGSGASLLINVFEEPFGLSLKSSKISCSIIPSFRNGLPPISRWICVAARGTIVTGNVLAAGLEMRGKGSSYRSFWSLQQWSFRWRERENLSRL